jgi:hypothetical protein
LARSLRVRAALHAALGEQIRQRRGAPGLDQRSDVLSLLLLARDPRVTGRLTYLSDGHRTS